jgi:hypothetical protein
LGFSIGGLIRRILGSPDNVPGRRGDNGAEPVNYNGFVIRPVSFEDGGNWVTAARISREFPDGIREHELIRADMFPSEATANECAVRKASKMIDDMGEDLFGAD